MVLIATLDISSSFSIQFIDCFKLEGSKLIRDQGRQPITLQLEDFAFGRLNIDKDLLDNLPFKKSLQKSQKVGWNV